MGARGIGAFEEMAGTAERLASLDPEEVRWRWFQDWLEPHLRTAMLDGEDGRWRLPALWRISRPKQVRDQGQA